MFEIYFYRHSHGFCITDGVTLYRAVLAEHEVKYWDGHITHETGYDFWENGVYQGTIQGFEPRDNARAIWRVLYHLIRAAKQNY